MSRTARISGLLVSGSLTLVACGGGDPPARPETLNRAAVVATICSLANDAMQQIVREQSVERAEGPIQQIVDLNLAVPDPDSTFSQVWQLADAWRGYLNTLDIPDITDNGNAVAGAMNNLVADCSMEMAN